MLHGPGGTYSTVFSNVHGDEILFETKHTFLALQMLPHAVGPGRRRQKIKKGARQEITTGKVLKNFSIRLIIWGK
jgi:hypothetical protein